MSGPKRHIKAIQEAQVKVAEASEALDNMIIAQEELQAEYDAKGETAQEKMDESYPWLSDFLGLDLTTLKDDMDTASGFDLDS